MNGDLALLGTTGLNGETRFIGKSKTGVAMGSAARPGYGRDQFGLVEASPLESDVSHDGDLVLEHGIIESNGYTWLLEDEDIEEDLKTRTRLDKGDAGTVLLGGRLSMVSGGYVARKVSQG